MRIFETYGALNQALELPALDAGAYRFAPAYGVSGFQCAGCGTVKTFPLGNCGTGYGVQDGQMFCYDCCTAQEVETMRQHQGPFYCYLAGDGLRVTSWPGGELGRVHRLRVSRSGRHGSEIARFHVRDTWGNWWSGRGAGRGICCTLRPMKVPDYAKRWGA